MATATILEYNAPLLFRKTCFQKYPVSSNIASGAAKMTLYLHSATCFHISVVQFSPVTAMTLIWRFAMWCSYLSAHVDSTIQSTWSFIKAERGDIINVILLNGKVDLGVKCV